MDLDLNHSSTYSQGHLIQFSTEKSKVHLLAVRQQICLRQIGVTLHLVDGRFVLGLADDVIRLPGVEVGQSYRSNQTFVH